MAKYQAYPEYKDSGVEWLGTVPIHWNVFRLKFGLSEALVYGANEAALDDNPDNPRYIRITDMTPNGTLRSDTFKSLPKTIAEPYMLIDKDILLARSGATVGKSFYFRSFFGTACFAGYLIRARFNSKKIAPRLAYWFFQSSMYWQYVNGSQIQATIQNVSAEKYSDLYFSTHREYVEQIRIAKFLDHETAKIDNLIEKQQQLIELLKEKHQAVISHAVTKGLNPDVPMKDSGVEWLGEVPEHWDITRAKFISNIFVPQRNKPELNGDVGVFWVTMENMNQQYITFSTQYVSDTAALKSGSKILPKGAVIASCVGNFGISAINEVDVIINQQLQAFQPVNVSANFLMALVSISKNYFELIGTAATLTYVNKEGFENLPVVVPPTAEQVSICKFIHDNNKKFELLIAHSIRQINLLQERRTALISAAVTGKIDVRNWVAPEAREAEVSQEATA